MKKILSLLIVMAMLFSMSGCFVTTTTNEKQETAGSSATKSEVVETAEPEDTESEEKVEEIWAKSYYVDEFDQPTDEWYICNTTSFIGKFSNSATTDSALTADIAIDATKATIFLYEYGRSNPVKNIFSDPEYYTIKVKDSSDNTYDMSGYIAAESGDRVIIDDAHKDKFIELLKGEGNISIYLETSKHTTSTYLFAAITGNFKDVYK